MIDYTKTRRVMLVLLAVLVAVGLTGIAVGSEIAASKTSAISAETGANKFYEGDTIFYEMTVRNPETNTETNTLTRIWDTLPDGTEIDFLDEGETLVQAPGDVATFNATYVVDWDDAVFSNLLGYYIVTNTFEATGFDSAGDFVDVLVTRNSQVLEFAEIGDFVWNDLNRDGIQDVGEPGIEGVTVHLWSADEECEPIEIIETTMTDEDGYYLFDGLRAGNYRVQFELPDGDWVFSPKDADGEGIEGEVNSDADETNGVTDCVELEPGDSKLFVDAGMYELFEVLQVSKTADTSFDRTHLWDIDKWVETEFGHTIGEEEYPKIWLWVDGSGDECATWYVEVTYLGSEDDNYNVSGEVTIENTGDLDAVITDVEDVLGGVAVNVDFGVAFPYTLAAGDTITGTYSEDDYFEGMNEVTVTTERDDYFADAAIVWGDPANEFYDVVDVIDESDLFGLVPLGTLDAADYLPGATVEFSYSECFAWADYDDPDPASWRYDNTATIVQTEQSASAVLKVNWMPPAEIGDFVWNDLNRDGIQDEGEPGIEGVTVHLWSADEECEPIEIIDTMMTDADGYYLFDGLMPGNYRVQFVLPDGTWYFSPQNADGEGIEGEFNSDADPMTGITDCVTLEAGDSKLFVDAGMYQEMEICWADETAWAYGGPYANPNWDFVNNRFWGWTNGPLGEGSYEWPIYAGAGQNILDNGEIVGALYVEYEDGCVTVTYELDAGYYLGETHLWVGDDVLPSVKRGRTTVYTNAPGQFPYGADFGFDPDDPSTWETTTWTWSKCGFEGDIYVAAHSVVWMQVECPPDYIE